MKGLYIGQRAETTRVFSEQDHADYFALSGDDASDAVPGPLLGGMFSFLLGTKLPGRGTNYLKQQLRFFAPARWGETLTASVEITRLRADKDLVNLKTRCVNEQGAIVCDGEALVLVRDLER
jgi:acyl dehydratase